MAAALAALHGCIGTRTEPEIVFDEVLTLMKLGAKVVCDGRLSPANSEGGADNV